MSLEKPKKRLPKIPDLKEFDSDTLKKALLGLTQFLEKKNDQDLLNSKGNTITLSFNLSKVPVAVNPKPLAISLPYPIYINSDCTVCLITRDPQKKWKQLIAEQWKPENFEDMECPKIIGLTKLKKNYPTMAARRELLRSYDFFLCDQRIIEQMPRILGRTFIDAGKLPIPVKIKEDEFLESIKLRLNETFMRIRTGTTTSIKIGFSRQPVKHLYQNAICVLKAVSKYFNPKSSEEIYNAPRGIFRDNDITHIHVSATDCPSLCVFTNPSIIKAKENILSAASLENLKKKQDKRKLDKPEVHVDSSVSSAVKKKRVKL